MSTTPTGVPIIDCGTCGRRHPISRSHCPKCGMAHLFECRRGDQMMATIITTPPSDDYESDLFGGAA